MGQCIAFDSHKHYTLATAERPEGGVVREARVLHERGALAEFLSGCDPGSPVAVETVGNWYWIVDEIEAAGFEPRLVHARKAKLMMGMINKTDKLDNRGMNQLQRNGTLPVVWIPPAELRDRRDLARTRMVLVRQRTQLKNRIHSVLDKYALTITEVTDTFGVRGRELLQQRISQLPPQTAYATHRLLLQVEVLDSQIRMMEERMHKVFDMTPEIGLLMTLPGVGFILAVVIWGEIGTIERFGGASPLTSYAGTTPRVHSSGGKTRYGSLRPDVNRYLKWAYVEAANAVCRNRRHFPQQHVSRLYHRIASKRGHQKAIGAVARHLAEASYWMLSKAEPYREPQSQPKSVSSTEG